MSALVITPRFPSLPKRSDIGCIPADVRAAGRRVSSVPDGVTSVASITMSSMLP